MAMLLLLPGRLMRGRLSRVVLVLVGSSVGCRLGSIRVLVVSCKSVEGCEEEWDEGEFSSEEAAPGEEIA